jgi:protoheme IX farnesyltransferase
MIKTYYLLTKPGIILGNLITTAGGFAMASKGRFQPTLFFSMLIGLGLVIGSACVCNNYIDRIIDAKMARTKNRALATGLIAPWKAILFALCLGAIGMVVLFLFTNALAASVAAVGFIVYVGIYTQLKKRTIHATLIGSIAGAIPPVVGYTAVSPQLDLAALLLFAILVFWQMPHFLAIAIYRYDDYFAASIPVLPIMKGALATKVQMLFYCIAFAGSSLLLRPLGLAGQAYLIVAAALSAIWIWIAISGFKAENDKFWARTMFRFSLIVITALCAMLSFDTIY